MSVGMWVWDGVTAPTTALLLAQRVHMGTGGKGPSLCCCQRGSRGSSAPCPARAAALLCLSCSHEAVPEPKAASCVSVASRGAFVLGFGRLSSECVFAERRRSPDEIFHSDALCEKISCFGPA